MILGYPCSKAPTRPTVWQYIHTIEKQLPGIELSIPHLVARGALTAIWNAVSTRCTRRTLCQVLVIATVANHTLCVAALKTQPVLGDRVSHKLVELPRYRSILRFIHGHRPPARQQLTVSALQSAMGRRGGAAGRPHRYITSTISSYAPKTTSPSCARTP